MRGTIVVVGLMVLSNALIIGTSVYRAQLIRNLVLSTAIASVLLLLGWLIARRFEADVSAEARRRVRQSHDTAFFDRRVLVVVGLVLGVTVMLSAIPLDELTYEAVYYLALVLCGISLSRWCKARSHVPVLAAAAILLCFSVIQSVIFVSRPDVQFQYGPERYLFAIWNHASRVNMFLVDAVVLWWSWRITLLVDATDRSSGQSLSVAR